MQKGIGLIPIGPSNFFSQAQPIKISFSSTVFEDVAQVITTFNQSRQIKPMASLQAFQIGKSLLNRAESLRIAVQSAAVVVERLK